jgi:hypothetical protein
MACTLHRTGDHSLMLSTIPGFSSGADLASITHVAFNNINLFVIQGIDSVGTKLTYTRASPKSASTTWSTFLCLFFPGSLLITQFNLSFRPHLDREILIWIIIGCYALEG